MYSAHKSAEDPLPCCQPVFASFQLHSNGNLPHEYCFLTVVLSSWQASLFGAQDGQGLSLVYYFTLPEGWEPTDVGNEAALGMLQRFIHDGREQDKYINILSILTTCLMVALWGSVRWPKTQSNRHMSFGPQHACHCPQTFQQGIAICCNLISCNELWPKYRSLLSSWTASISTFGPIEASAFRVTLYLCNQRRTIMCKGLPA